MTTVIRSAAGSQPSPTRQAVILIHGIGEQRPMATLRSFVDAFLEPDTFHSKPDKISSSYELRRIKLRRVKGSAGEPDVNPEWPETDFFEYYWAHRMYGTRLAHVVNWLRALMVRGAKAAWRGEIRDPAYHPRLKWMVLIAWLGVPFVLGVVVWSTVRQPIGALATGIGTLAAFVLWRRCIAPILGTTLTDVVGDAARYLDVSPQNVARRYDIIRGGIDMVREIHNAKDVDGSTKDVDGSKGRIMYRYGRLIMIGHSLGSVIAYDVLRHYWFEVNGGLRVVPEDLDGVERFDGGNEMPLCTVLETHLDATRFRHDQRQCWRKVNAWWLGQPHVARELADEPGRGRWLVTDFVTVGSPLTYAALLLADGLADLAQKKTLRELITCPPDRSRHVNKGRFSVSLSEEAGRFTYYPILGHQAPFAITRWTNMYFRNDPIGGPLGEVFLHGIEEHDLDPGRLRWRPVSAHVSYWKTKNHKAVEAAQPCIERIRRILTQHVTEEGAGTSASESSITA
jgi:hypothetical protein